MNNFVSVINSGSEVFLETVAKLKGHDGWGMIPRHLITSRGPLQNGVTVVDRRVDPRVGILVFQIPKSDLEDMYTVRETFMNLFAPGNNSKLRFYLPYGQRQIDCYYQDSMTMPWTVQDGASQKFALQLFCPDGVFYDPAGEAVSFALGAGSSFFTVPIVVPISVGASTLDQSQPVYYRGSVDTQPDLIRITGPVTDPVLRNLLTDEKLDFTGYTIAAGHYYDIDCRYTYQTVKLDGVTDKSAELSSDSDLATFHFKAATDGSGLLINTLKMTGSAANEATKVDITYFKKVAGI